MINLAQDLSRIHFGLHDEIFQGSMPVLAGVDAASTYCYLLAAAEQTDTDTWARFCRNSVGWSRKGAVFIEVQNAKL